MEKTIGVVHGGTGYERDKSLHYGKHVAKILHNLGMNVLEMHLHPNGSWTIDGQVGDIEHALKKTSKVWNCLVGVDGEKAIVEKLCDKCKVKVVGHNILHTELAQNKKNMKYAISGHKVKVPFGKIISPKEYSQEKLMEIFSTVPMPAIIPP
jgi:D-alanine-D-alanine ligase-like ATP-grasp enzyme